MPQLMHASWLGKKVEMKYALDLKYNMRKMEAVIAPWCTACEGLLYIVCYNMCYMDENW